MHTSFTKSNGKSWEHSPTVSECDIFTFFYTFNPFEKQPAICKVVNKNNKKKENNDKQTINIKMKHVDWHWNKCFISQILDGLKSSSTYILSKTCSPLQTPAYFHSTSNSVSIHIFSSRSKFQPSLLGSIKTGIFSNHILMH